jgi:hypothetical protein
MVHDGSEDLGALNDFKTFESQFRSGSGSPSRQRLVHQWGDPAGKVEPLFRQLVEAILLQAIDDEEEKQHWRNEPLSWFFRAIDVLGACSGSVGFWK